ncbi:MAG: long-chain fatty acid--CoA ligase [Sphingomonadaceae bacterium]|nr:long-chain fatty acid--CoA ligase [Sphingomonadaceae bacterium]
MPPSARTDIPGPMLLGGAENAIFYGGRWRSRDWLERSARAILAATGATGAIGLVARNRPHHIAAMAGALDAGRALTMISSAQSPVRLAADIRRLCLRAIVAERSDWTSEALEAARDTGSAAISVEDAQECAAVELVVEPGEGKFREPPPGTALELLSSGTTGAPKQVALSRFTVANTLAASASMYAGSEGQAAQIMAAPLGNITGLSYAMPPLLNGQPLVLLDKFSPEEWAGAVREFRPTRGALPPAGIRMMLDSDVPPEWLSSLEVVGVGGGRIEPELHVQFEQRFDVAVTPAYGATEFAGVVAAWTLDLYRQFHEAKRGSAGQVVPNAQLRVVDMEAGKPRSPGEEGLLEIQVDRIGPDWIRTTDLAHIDEDGFLFLHGRADAAINRGGFKIVPETITNALCEHPAVGDAAAIGIPDERLGEVPVAAVELAPGQAASSEELRKFLSDRLLAYQQPVEIHVLNRLPRNPSMKVALGELKVLFQ